MLKNLTNRHKRELSSHRPWQRTTFFNNLLFRSPSSRFQGLCAGSTSLFLAVHLLRTLVWWAAVLPARPCFALSLSFLWFGSNGPLMSAWWYWCGECRIQIWWLQQNRFSRSERETLELPTETQKKSHLWLSDVFHLVGSSEGFCNAAEDIRGALHWCGGQSDVSLLDSPASFWSTYQGTFRQLVFHIHFLWVLTENFWGLFCHCCQSKLPFGFQRATWKTIRDKDTCLESI